MLNTQPIPLFERQGDIFTKGLNPERCLLHESANLYSNDDAERAELWEHRDRGPKFCDDLYYVVACGSKKEVLPTVTSIEQSWTNGKPRATIRHFWHSDSPEVFYHVTIGFDATYRRSWGSPSPRLLYGQRSYGSPVPQSRNPEEAATFFAHSLIRGRQAGQGGPSAETGRRRPL
jgi:hypothetical protein